MSFGLKAFTALNDEVLFTSRPISLAMSVLLWREGRYTLKIPRPDADCTYFLTAFPGAEKGGHEWDHNLGFESGVNHWQLAPTLVSVSGSTAIIQSLPSPNTSTGYPRWSLALYARKN